MLSIQVFDAKMTLICNLKTKTSDSLEMKVLDFVYFDEEKTKVAATIESHFSLDKLNLYRRKNNLGELVLLFLLWLH